MKRIVIRALVGLGLGLGFAVLEFQILEIVERAFHRSFEPFYLVLGILNAPADGLGYVWVNVLHWPPHQEAAWVVVPVVTALMQWGLIGFLGGLWWGFKSTSSASGAGSRVWPVALGGVAAMIACGLLAWFFGALFAPPFQPHDSVRPGSNAAAPERAQVDEAIVAMDANPNDAEAQYRLGVTLADRDRLDEAILHFRKSLEVKPNYAEAQYQIGLAMAKKGMPVDAIMCYERALKIKPDFAEARQHLDEALETNEGKDAHP
jgi:hypothetical protein